MSSRIAVEDFLIAWVRHFMDQILNGLRSLLLDGMELNDVQTVRARQLLFDASKCNKASIYDLIAGLSDNTKAKNSIKTQSR